MNGNFVNTILDKGWTGSVIQNWSKYGLRTGKFEPTDKINQL